MCKGPAERSAWLRVLPLPHSSGHGTGMARASSPLLQHVWLEGSSLRPAAAPAMLPVPRPGAGAEHPIGARVEQDCAPGAGSAHPGTAPGAGRGADAGACLFWLGPAVASSAARPCTHFWKCFETVSPEGCCCLGAAQAIKPNSSNAGGTLTPWVPLHRQCPVATGQRNLNLRCLTLAMFSPFWQFLAPPTSIEERRPMAPLSLPLPTGHPVHRWQKHAGESCTAVPASANWVTVHGGCAGLVLVVFAPLHPAAQGFSC